MKRNPLLSTNNKKMSKGEKLGYLTYKINGYVISWSKLYVKWQVKKSKIVLEEFVNLDKAKEFAKNN